MEPFRYLKTGEDRNLSFAKKLWEFAKEQKHNLANDFDPESSSEFFCLAIAPFRFVRHCLPNYAGNIISF